MPLKFKKWDIAAIAFVALAAAALLLLFLPRTDTADAKAEIYQDGQLVQTLSLKEDREVTVTGRYTATVTVRDGRIAVTASDCPGGDCVRSGWAAGAGKSIVCLPNGLEIRILSASDGVDFVVG